MIVYQDILGKLAAKGWTSYRIAKERALGGGTMARIRNGQSISTDTLDVLCRLCECQPGDLIRYEDKNENNDRNSSRI